MSAPMHADTVLRTQGLGKRFGTFAAVRDLALSVQRGDVYGFLGLNGAGKTTTIRMILGLIRPTSGSVSLLGHDPQRHRLDVMRRIGALVEVPSFYPYLTGRQNLDLIARLLGGDAPTRVRTVLEQVGLGDRGETRVRAFSQGMRQRLGVAQALLGDPELVILDEPTNGLDPRGIQEVRDLIQRLQRERGTTFFLSSHLLNEVESTCNRIGIVRNGTLVEEGTVASILERTTGAVRIRALPEPAARQVVASLEWVRLLDGAPPGTLRLHAPVERIGELNRVLVQAGLSVTELAPQRMSLEEYFLEQGGKR